MEKLSIELTDLRKLPNTLDELEKLVKEAIKKEKSEIKKIEGTENYQVGRRVYDIFAPEGVMRL